MGEIVVSDQKFRIKGDEPTEKESLAIESYFGAKSLKGKDGVSFDEELEMMITPEDVLSDAQKGKYNKDTESFLKSPGFGRIVTEVGLSIAGGLAGIAMAPLSGGSSLAVTAVTAARIARIARPLLNISAKTVGKVGRATAGAAVGGGAGAGIAQTFDPRESIVKEVTRGAIQGGFGEVLGFGMAGGLAKMYNKVTGKGLHTITGAQQAASIVERDKEFFSILKDIRAGKAKPTQSMIDDFAAGKTKSGKAFTEQQMAILKDPKLIEEVTDTIITKRGTEFFADVEKANITPGVMTQNSAIDMMEGIAGSALFGSGAIRSAQEMGKQTVMEGLDVFTDIALRGANNIDDTGLQVGILLQNSVTNNQKLFNNIKMKAYDEFGAKVKQVTSLADGTPNPKFQFDIAGPSAKPKLNVWDARTDKIESVSNLGKYTDDMMAKYAKVTTSPKVREILGQVMAIGPRTNYNELSTIYRTLGSNVYEGEAKVVQAEVMKRMEGILNDSTISKLPADLNILRGQLHSFNKFGGTAFNNTIAKKILRSEVGQEKLYQQIVVANQESYTKSFMNLLDSKMTIPGTKTTHYLFPDRELIKSGIQGQFLKNFLNVSQKTEGQYQVLNAAGASKFLRQHKDLINDGTFLTTSQRTNIKDYAEALKFTTGRATAPGAAGEGTGKIFIQLKQAGAVTQIGGILAGGGGYIDPGTAGMFVLAPWALARAFASPKITKLLINGLGKGPMKIDNYGKYKRYMAQLSTGLVGQGLVGPEQAKLVMDNIEGDKDQYEQFFATGVFEGPTPRELGRPEAAPAIPVEVAEETITETAAAPARSNLNLPNVTPGNVGQTGINPQARMALASGNIDGALAANSMGQMKTGGIVSVFKKN